MLAIIPLKSHNADYATFSSFISPFILHIMVLSDLAFKLHVSKPLEILNMVSDPKNHPLKTFPLINQTSSQQDYYILPI